MPSADFLNAIFGATDRELEIKTKNLEWATKDLRSNSNLTLWSVEIGHFDTQLDSDIPVRRQTIVTAAHHYEQAMVKAVRWARENIERPLYIYLEVASDPEMIGPVADQHRENTSDVDAQDPNASISAEDMKTNTLYRCQAEIGNLLENSLSDLHEADRSALESLYEQINVVTRGG